MIAVKAINHSFCPIQDSTLYLARFPSTRSSILCLCKSSDSDPQSPPPPPPDGDARSQELLARIAMLQAQKVRLTDYLDERSAYLTQFGEEAIAELDKVGDDALKGLDEASERITANIESSMLEFEEFAELNRREIEENENKLVDFEDQMEDDRNEGLFFKNLRQKAPVVDKEKAKEEAEKIKDVTKEKAGSRTRKNIYLFFIGLLSFGIVDSLSSSSPTDWRKVAALAAILVALVSQFIYEQKMSSETSAISQEKTNQDDDNEEETK
ncbi:uncharacterized protein LOC114730847 [Neltuma alba]|uniref:uncharacterized protein LOC114730847 n=1 Tax=Neltuma alba TaxID=207710 RepID=UPI0010A47F2D|nr:uncharacterized protein LOC114730847 [Prosopis alba]